MVQLDVHGCGTDTTRSELEIPLLNSTNCIPKGTHPNWNQGHMSSTANDKSEAKQIRPHWTSENMNKAHRSKQEPRTQELDHMRKAFGANENPGRPHEIRKAGAEQERSTRESDRMKQNNMNKHKPMSQESDLMKQNNPKRPRQSKQKFTKQASDSTSVRHSTPQIKTQKSDFPQLSRIPAYGWLSKLWSLLGSSKRDPNFDNYPYCP